MIPAADQIKLYRQMLLIRRMEERVAEMYGEQKIGGFTHLYIGQEAVAVGGISSLNHDDYVIDTYRDHGHYLARGGDPKAFMAELFGKATGCCKGKGGSMHLADVEHYFFGGTGIVGGSIPIAAGLGLACAYRGDDRIVMAFFGDGATNQGVWHEGLNFAKVWNLPVIFVCENNFYGIGTDVRLSSSVSEVHKKASGYGMPGYKVNGMDVLEVRRVCDEVVRLVRGGSGPALIEAVCYRYQGHSMTDPGRYRARAEEELWRKRDPIPRLAKALLAEGLATEERLAELDREIERSVEEAVAFAEASPDPDPSTLYDHVFAERYPSDPHA
jgi:pyruvate dehydrogenase E1 component alpha subunit